MTPDPQSSAAPQDVSRSRRQSTEATRRRILDAAAVSFGSNGYSKTAVQQVLANAGVSAPVIYYHFGNKLGLFVAAAEEGYREFIGELRAALVGIEDFGRALDALLEAAGSAHLRSPTIAPIVFAVQVEARRDTAVAEAVQPLLRGFRDLIGSVASLASDSLVADVGHDGLRRAIGAMINGLLSVAVTLERAEDIAPTIAALRRLVGSDLS